MAGFGGVDTGLSASDSLGLRASIIAAGPSEPTLPRPLLGIGSCLAGNAVRYNGKAKAPNKFIRSLYEDFEIRAFCPEVGIGMSAPRPPIHLVGPGQAVRALDVASHSRDYTDSLADYANKVLADAPELCGYILVKGSPSCGYHRVKRFAANGDHIASDQQGIFAAALGRVDPLLPLEDDERLSDPGLRESFLTGAYTYHEWKALNAGGLTAHKLIDFYSRCEHLVMAQHIASYRELGRLLVDADKLVLEQISRQLISLVMSSLSRRGQAA